MSKADRVTPTTKETEYYSDFLMNLDRNPISGELARVSNARSVIRAMRNLININRGEIPFNSTLGCGIRKMLFEPFGDITTDRIRLEIITTIEQHEPRVQLKQVSVQPYEQSDAYNVVIYFALVNVPSEIFSFSTVLKRVR